MIPPRPKFGVLIPNSAETFPGSPRRVGGRDSLPRGQAPQRVWAELFALWKAQTGLISPPSLVQTLIFVFQRSEFKGGEASLPPSWKKIAHEQRPECPGAVCGSLPGIFGHLSGHAAALEHKTSAGMGRRTALLFYQGSGAFPNPPKILVKWLSLVSGPLRSQPRATKPRVNNHQGPSVPLCFAQTRSGCHLIFTAALITW